MLKKNFLDKTAAYLLPVLLLAVLLASCPGPMDPEPLILPEDLAQYFQSLPYSAEYAYYDDGFEVDASAKTFYYYGDSTFEKKWGGPIVKIVPDGGAFVMIVKITEVTGEWTPAPETGKYFAAAYKNLTGSSVNSSTAFKADGNNTGANTLAEAESEYTIANGYFDYLDSTFYYPHTASAVTLASLQGDWVKEEEEDDDHFIQIKGTKLTEWSDSGDDGIYNADNDILSELGDVVDHTDTAQASGVLYVKIIDGTLITDKYIAVAWKNKTTQSVSFMTGAAEYGTLAEVKAARNDANDTDQFPDDDFYVYTK